MENQQYVSSTTSLFERSAVENATESGSRSLCHIGQVSHLITMMKRDEGMRSMQKYIVMWVEVHMSQFRRNGRGNVVDART